MFNKRKFCQENTWNNMKTHKKYHSNYGLSTSPHLSIACPQAIILIPNTNSIKSEFMYHKFLFIQSKTQTQGIRDQHRNPLGL